MGGFINENKLIASIILVALLLLLRWVISRLLQRKAEGDTELFKNWSNTLTNTTQLLIVLGLMIIWVTELRYAALSVAAFIVAIIVATREFVQNFLGALYMASVRPFSIGEWIRIGDSVGEVVRSDWLTTVLLEVDVVDKTYKFTGKTLVIPNNQFIASPVQNLNFMRRYIVHSFSLVREPGGLNGVAVKNFLRARAEQYCQPFSDVAERYNEMIEHRLGIEIPGPEASVRLETTNVGKTQFTVSIFCPTGEVVTIEQKITDDFFDYCYRQSIEVPEKNNRTGESEQ